MHEVNISTRIPKDLEKDLKEYMRRENVDRSIALRKLLVSALQEWKEKTALKMLENGDISFSKASEISGLDVWTFAERAKESGIVWIKMKPEEIKREMKG
ncbi:MAG: UPF0175 family protein [Candidatus Aenigmarchaeota archaeon]|nr:UPF0175 family protein [Candidatus Aenigmarchaeota archaeon]MDI6722007.1 UPF0175 family protein [Candidatus Aenigmarchaeota archaeon]